MGVTLGELGIEGVKIEDIEICECECHKIGVPIRHCAPCCSLTYEEYIVDGEIDMVLWAVAYREHQDWLKTKS